MNEFGGEGLPTVFGAAYRTLFSFFASLFSPGRVLFFFQPSFRLVKGRSFFEEVPWLYPFGAAVVQLLSQLFLFS